MDRIDLHAHTSWSDGTCGVAEMYRKARQEGLSTVALTDHDTVAGWQELPSAVAASGVAAVPGIEVSAQHEGRSVHVLALLVDPAETTELSREMARAREARVERARRMVELIAADHPVSWQDVQAQVAGETTVIGRPHIADALVAAGAAADRSAAFAEILRPSGPYYVPYYAPSPVAAVQAIAAAGGISIAAHPGSVTRDDDLPLSLLEEMVGAGLDGVEVDHREHDEAERARLRDFAEHHQLLSTGGSDYHGSGKPNELGENLTAPETLEEIARRARSGVEIIRP